MKVPSTQAQNNFGKYLKYVEAGEEIIVTRKGKDIAKISPCVSPDGGGVAEGLAEYRTYGAQVTYEEFVELSEHSEQRFELIDGVVYNLASPSYRHQMAVHELHGALYNWFKGKDCTPLTSPFDITFAQDPSNICVVQPDIVVICDRDNRDHKDRYKGVPTLVVEVLSPSSRGKDTITKLNLYKRCDVKEYWVVDPLNEQVIVYQLADDDIVNYIAYLKSADQDARSVCFDGLSIPLRDVFA